MSELTTQNSQLEKDLQSAEDKNAQVSAECARLAESLSRTDKLQRDAASQNQDYEKQIIRLEMKLQSAEEQHASEKAENKKRSE